MAYIICDPGSTHMGKMEYAKELIDVAVEAGTDAVKFQLFKNKPPNIELPYEWFPELVQYGKEKRIEIFASVFDDEGVRLVYDNGCKYIKNSYSRTKRWIENGGDMVEFVATPIYSLDIALLGIMKNDFRGKEPIFLYCIPEYPVKYMIDFEGVFPMFHGFSDHTMGYMQTLKAVYNGANYIEKHITLNRNDINCLDNNFALKPKQLCLMVKAIRRIG